MSATKNATAAPAAPVEAPTVDVEAVYAPFVAPIQEALTEWEAAEGAVTVSRVNLGRIIGQTVAALTTAGASAEEAQGRIMQDVSEFTNAVEWDTISGWVRAASVADSLPAELAEKFSTEALKEIGKIAPEPKEGTEGVTRVEFAEGLAEEGVTSVRAIREAVKDEKGSPAPRTAGTAAQAADAVKVIGKLITAGSGFEGAELLPIELIEALIMLGVDTRTKCPKFKRPSIVAAVQEVFHREEATR